MRHTQQITCSLTAVVLLVLVGRFPAGAQSAAETTAGQGSIVFVGRVLRVGAVSVREVSASPRTIVVRVNAIVEKPKPVSLKPGDEVTVEVKDPSAFSEGAQATFYTDGWVFAEGLAVREVRHEMATVKMGPRAIQKKRQQLAATATQTENPQLSAKIQAADVVLVGRVTAVRPVTMVASAGPPKRITEHDPNWQEAVIMVQSPIKGVQANQQVVVRFAASLDVAWRGAPKLKVGQQSTFILHRDEISGAPKAMLAGAEVNTYVATNAQDILPASEEKRIRAIVAQQ